MIFSEIRVDNRIIQLVVEKYSQLGTFIPQIKLKKANQQLYYKNINYIIN